MRVLVVDGFAESHAVAAAAEAALGSRGHDVAVLRLVDAGFDRYMSEAERLVYHEIDNLITPEQRAAVAQLRRAEAILVVGPVLEGAVAPCIKSWVERVFVPEVGFTFTPSGRVTRALTNVRRVGMIAVADGTDAWAHRRNGSTRSTMRNIRLMSSRWCRCTYVAVEPGVDGDARITAALRRW